jgi:hypothetical protein
MTRLDLHTFRAWRITEMHPHTQANCYPLEIGIATTLVSAVFAAEVQCRHKESLLIEQCDVLTGRVQSIIYRIKRCTRTRREYAGDPVHLAGFFQPAPLFVATPDADVVGVDLTMVVQS